MYRLAHDMLRSVANSRTWQRVQRELLRRSGARFPALDGVRALAALLIVLFHATVCVEQTGGEVVSSLPLGWTRWFLTRLWIGVDIFFVLSGFLIGRILLLQLRSGRIDFRGFYVRRVSRIFPAYYVVLAVAVFALSRLQMFELLYDHIPLGELMRRSLANYLYISNYTHDDRAPDAMGWAWSLCVEEHFYLVFPAILGLLSLVGSRLRLSVLAVLPLLPMVARAIAYIRHPDTALWHRLNWESHTHCDGLLLGALIAYLFVHYRERLAHLTRRLQPLLLAVALVCFTSVFWRGGVLRTGFFAVVAQLFVLAVGTALAITSCLFVDNVISRCLAHPFWYPIARVSYGMYLIHPFVALWLLSLRPGVQLSLASSAPRLLAFGCGAAMCTFAFASVMFLCIELPLLRYGLRFTPRNEQPGSAVAGQ